MASPAPAFESAYRRPSIALAVAAIGFAVTAVLILTYPALRTALAGWPQWMQRLADVVILSAPLIAAVLVAGRIAADGVGRATGIRHWRWIDPVLGVLTALVVRAAVELVQPSSGSLSGPFIDDSASDTVAGAILLAIGVVLVSPLVEELFFRGLVLRALNDALSGAGRWIAAIISVVVSTAAFVLLHLPPWDGDVPVAFLVGTAGVGVGCGILTIVTGRLGAAITAHVTFNAIGVALLLW